MSIRVFFIDNFVIIREVTIACIVWRIKIHHIKTSFMGIGECYQSMQVVSLDDSVVGIVLAILVVEDSLVVHLVQHGDARLHLLPGILCGVLPYQPVFLLLTNQTDEL